MKKLGFITVTAAFALAACGETTDASEEAVADTVEVPADEAMIDEPAPVIDEAPEMEAEEADAAMNVTEEEAESAADEAMDTVGAAEAAMAEMDAMEEAAEAVPAE